MSSKLRLGGKATRGTAALSEKEQIDLAIALSLQHQAKEPQQLARTVSGAPSIPIEQPNLTQAAQTTIAPDLQLAYEPRKRRAAALRPTYIQEDSDSEDSQSPSADEPQGADDYKPESSDSKSESDSGSDFAGDDDSDDKGPRKKQKSEGAKGKKAPAKAPMVRKKPGAGEKAAGAGASAHGPKPPAAPGVPGACAARVRRKDAGASPVVEAPHPAPAAHVTRARVAKPTTAAHNSASTAHVVRAPVGKQKAVGRITPGAAELGATRESVQQVLGPIGVLHAELPGPGADSLEGGQPDGAYCVTDPPPCPELDDDAKDATAEGKATVAEIAQPKAVELTANAAASAVPKAMLQKPPATKASSLGKPSSVKGAAQVTPSAAKQPPKPLALTNRVTPGPTPAPVPFKPPIEASGGASSLRTLMSLPSGAMAYRVPGLRRPGGSSVTKKAS